MRRGSCIEIFTIRRPRGGKRYVRLSRISERLVLAFTVDLNKPNVRNDASVERRLLRSPPVIYRNVGLSVGGLGGLKGVTLA